ncbi:MAG: hypothetical protein GC203_01165 [Phenylobacterium sp.]|uniref:terminase small subunit-like protein n=1 Tax=Phenylobacterium sp. TaxID=1871053 RepID=UPI0025F5B5B0|nr:hypothetical protein [Phenylobacterium sp.]MBI1196453.1 hypothetical protein [Phenylobacterium sp.]
MADAGFPARPGAAAPGRSVYSEDVGAAICARVAAGEGLRAICADVRLPHRTTVRNWAKAHPDFAVALAQAQATARAARVRDDDAAAAERAARRGTMRCGTVRRGSARGGRPSAYTPEMGAAVCARLEAGESLTAIGADPAMPAYGTVLKWVRLNPGFRAMYAAARAVQGDVLIDEACDVAAQATRESVPLSRLRFDVIRWRAALLAPKKYADVGAAAAGPVVFFAMRFERGPNGTVLCAPPRNAREAQAWVAATGEPYAAGIGPTGEIRPPLTGAEDWMAQGAAEGAAEDAAADAALLRTPR